MRLNLLHRGAAIAVLLLLPVKASTDFAIGLGILDPMYVTTITFMFVLSLALLCRHYDFIEDSGVLGTLPKLLVAAWLSAVAVFILQESFYEQNLSIEGLDSATFNGLVLISYPLYFIAGYYLRFDRIGVLTWMSGVLICMAAIFAAGGGFLREVDPVQYTILNHLALSDALAAIGLLLLGSARSFHQRLVVSVIVALLLSSILSRTGFFLFVAAALAFEIVVRSGGDMVKSGIFAGIALAVVWLLFSALDYQDVPGFKALRLPGLFGTDASADERYVMMAAGVRRLMSTWFLGDYWGHVAQFGSAGSYIHNIVAYWQQFGLITFLCVCAALVWSVREVVRQLGHADEDTRAHLYERLPLLLYVLVASILARSHVFPLLWLGFGLLQGCRLGIGNQFSSGPVR